MRLTKFFLIFCCCLFSDIRNLQEEARIKETFLTPALETLLIPDWENPRFEDYLLIQEHLKTKYAEILATPAERRAFQSPVFGWITYRLGRLKLIEEGSLPVSETIYFNGDPTNKEKCVICYASYRIPGTEREYARGLYWIIESLKRFHFDGHLLYRIGGWPNLQKGRLKLADVPYAFKPLLFEEARDLGYQKILWLDAAALPIKSLDPLFQVIEREGCCFFGGEEVRLEDLNNLRYVMRAMEISGRRRYKQALSQVVGLNMHHSQAARLLDRWIQAAERKVPFLEPSGDQFSFTLLVNELGLLSGKLPEFYYVEGNHAGFFHPKYAPRAIIYHQYDLLDPDRQVPADLFP